MRALACLACLSSLPLGRASMWEHRGSVGKAFDRLRRWCEQSDSPLAAELRDPTVALCRRWRRQPRPAFQDPDPQQKSVRIKVLDMIRQGLLGMSTPSAAPRDITQGYLHPSLLAAEVELLLFGLHCGPTLDYRAQARMLRANLALPDNGALRARLLTSEITAEELVAMDSRSLAPETLQDKRRAVTLEAIRNTVTEKQAVSGVIDAEEMREHIKDGLFLPSLAPRAARVAEDLPDELGPGAAEGQEGAAPGPRPSSELVVQAAGLLPEILAVLQADAAPQGSEARGASAAPEDPSLGGGTPCDAAGAAASAGMGASPVPDESSSPAVCDDEEDQLMDLIGWFSQPVM